MLNSKTLISSLAMLIAASAAQAGGNSGSPAASGDPLEMLDQPTTSRIAGVRRAISKDGPVSTTRQDGPIGNGDVDTAPPPPTPGHCVADINLSGAVDWVDIVDYLNMYFAGHIAADLGGTGEVDLSDLYKFLDAWTSGC